MSSRAKIRAKLRARAKQIPFNVSLPWGDSVAAYMGVSSEELKTNYKNDPRLHEELYSACGLVRDYSIKELLKANPSASKALKDICYGSGYAMVDGKMVQTGACYPGIKTPKPFPNNKDSVTFESYVNKCLIKKDPIFVNFDKAAASAFAPKTWPERLEIKHMIGYPNELVPAATEPPKSFIQKGFNSNLEIPGYNNPDLNGKGYTFNQLPHERYDDQADNMLYKPNAYATGTSSVRPPAEVNKGVELAKKLAEENKALGTNLATDSLVKTDIKFDFKQLKVPEWVCTSICAGLNIDDLQSGESTIEDPADFNATDGNLFRTEEE